jgi:hypothetical protein
MREYQTNSFKITFNGDQVSVDIDWEQLTNYIVAKYKPTKHYIHNDEAFFTVNMAEFDLDEICEDMDYFNDIVDLSDEEMTVRITSLLSIASTKTKKAIYDYLGQTAQNVQNSGEVEQLHIQEIQHDVPKPRSDARTDNSIF